MAKPEPKNIPVEYYAFAKYNKPVRLITYWYQLHEVLTSSPGNVLEVGIGSGLVSSYLKHLDIPVDTLDINENLGADLVGDVRDLKGLAKNKYDTVLCARVLHHLPFEDLMIAVESLCAVTKKRLIITLPVNDCRVYMITRYTSSNFYTLSIPLPLSLKKLIGRIQKKAFGSGLWMLNDSKEHDYNSVTNLLRKGFNLTRFYRIPEDMAHAVFVFDF